MNPLGLPIKKRLQHALKTSWLDRWGNDQPISGMRRYRQDRNPLHGLQGISAAHSTSTNGGSHDLGTGPGDTPRTFFNNAVLLRRSSAEYRYQLGGPSSLHLDVKVKLAQASNNLLEQDIMSAVQ
jgi:hypothetical protein